jgi:pilus assembly protein FimV
MNNTGGKAVTARASRERSTHKLLSPRTLASAVFVALASLAAPADAAGLGRLSVQSGLGQPLRAEVEVTSLTRDEAQSLSARLAQPDAFRQAGLEFNPALTGLRFAIEPRGGRTFVRITSSQPINEPFVDLLLELNWASGKFVREYTFLLDPPEVRASREPVEGGASRAEAVAPVAGAAPSAAVAAPTPAAAAPTAPSARPVPAAAAPGAERAARMAAARAAAASAPAASAPSAPAPASGAASGPVEVRRGDTLGNIARGLRPEGVSLDQAMVAIYRANPSAFIGNVNLVREGARLSIPDRGAMAAIDAGEATREIRLQSTDFAAYRQRLAGAPRTVDAPRSGQTAAGTVGGTVEDRSSAAGGDQLRLTKPGTGTGAAGAAVGSQATRAGAAEQDVARGAALKEANSRIADLEKNVGDLQKLLELKNRSMADLQKQLDDAKASGRAVTGQVATAPAPTPPVPAAPTAPAPAAKAEPSPAAAAPTAADPPSAAAPPPADRPAGDAARVEPLVPAAPMTQAPPVSQTPPSATSPAAGQTGVVDDLLENPFLLPGLGGLALLGAGYGWYAMRRRRKVEKFEDSLIAAEAFTANSLFGSTGGQSVDTSNSVFSSGAASTAADVHSTEVDPIAEADVYIAYGREAQAEEILKEALKRQPERQAIRLKMLEIYSGRKDAKAFEAVARDMHDMTGGRNEEWPKVVTLGLSLDPANPLYGGGQQAGPAIGIGAGAVAGAGAAADLDFPELPIGGFDRPVASQAQAQSQSPFQSQADTVEMPPGTVDDGIPSLDFDLNIDTRIDRAAGRDGAQIGDTLSGPQTDAPGSAGRGGSLDDRFELPSLDLDEPPAGPSRGLDIDLPALEQLTQTGSGGASSHTGLDLSPISLDLESATVATEEAEASVGSAGRWQEMATKLDLASAYEEIGDKEGARELLQEVIKGGDGGQQQKARAMLSKIG